MLKRVKSKKTVKTKMKKVPVKTVAVQKKKAIEQEKKAASFNEKAQWKAFRELKAKVNKKLQKLKSDFKKERRPELLVEDINMLELLGGEVHYMLIQLEKLDKSKLKAKNAAKKKAAKKTVKKVAKKAVKKKATKRPAARKAKK